MSFVEQQVTVCAPFGHSAKRLRRFLRAHASAETNRSTIDLRVALHAHALPMPFAAHRTLVVTLEPHRSQNDISPRYDVRWAPALPGPFPLFAGELFAVGDDDYTSFTLVLRGTYAPPIGLGGACYDGAADGFVARATARDLLVSIREFTERDFKDDERREAELRREARHRIIPDGDRCTADERTRESDVAVTARALL